MPRRGRNSGRAAAANQDVDEEVAMSGAEEAEQQAEPSANQQQASSAPTPAAPKPLTPSKQKQIRRQRNLAVKPGHDAPMLKVTLGDEDAFIEHFSRVADDLQTVIDRNSTSHPHDCGPACLTLSEQAANTEPSGEGQLKQIRAVCNPFLVPMALYGFVRVAMVLKPNARCLLCEALEEPGDPCQRLHIAYVTPCGKVLWCPEHVRQFLQTVAPPGAGAAVHFSENYFTFSMIFQLKQVTVEAYEYLPDISHGLESVPVSLVNTVKDLPLPKFNYIRARLWDVELRSHVPELPESPRDFSADFKSCCSCTDNCTGEQCECKQLTMRENCGKGTYMHRRLYHHLKRGVYECNSKCPCNAACENRVSQGGLICRLQFFPCGQKGWGVRTLHFIPKGMFIGLYNGRVIQSWQINPQDLRQSQYICELMDANEGHGVDGAGDDDEEALEKKRQKAKRAKKKQRRRARAAAKRKNNATAPVASTSAAAAAADAAAADSDSSGSSGSEESPPPPPAADGPGLSREQLFRKNTSKEFLVDGSVDGNVTRSFNHSCAPNIFSQQIFTETHDIRFPEMALFAARDIHPLEELCWNYSYRVGKDQNRVLYCHCSTFNCALRLI